MNVAGGMSPRRGYANASAPPPRSGVASEGRTAADRRDGTGLRGPCRMSASRPCFSRNASSIAGVKIAKPSPCFAFTRTAHLAWAMNRSGSGRPSPDIAAPNLRDARRAARRALPDRRRRRPRRGKLRRGAVGRRPTRAGPVYRPGQHRAVVGEGEAGRRLRDLYAGDGRRAAREAGPGSRHAARRPRRPVLSRLSAAVRPPLATPDRGGGADALAPSAPRRHFARDVHPARRGDGRHRRTRTLRAGERLSRRRRLAGRPSRFGQRFAGAIPPDRRRARRSSPRSLRPAWRRRA